MIKRLLLGLLALVALLVVAALLVPSLISVDSYRGRIEAAATAATGRKLEIKGPLKLSILPELAISAHDVVFANAAGASDPQMVSLKRLVLDLQLLPLLHGGIVFDRVVLEEPNIALELDKNGRPNWQFAEPPAGAAPASGSNAGGFKLSGIQLGKFKIENGKITFRDMRTGALNQLDKIDVTLKLPDLDGPYSAEGTVTWAGEAVSLTISGQGLGKLMAAANSPFSVSIAAPAIKLTLEGMVTKAQPLALEGATKIDVPSLGALAAWLGKPIPAGSHGIAALSLAGKLTLSGSKLAFTAASLTLDKMKGTGTIGFDSRGAKPRIEAALDFDKLDANPYLPPEKSAASVSPAGGKAGAAGWRLRRTSVPVSRRGGAAIAGPSALLDRCKCPKAS